MPELVTYNNSIDCIYVDSYGKVTLDEVQLSLENVVALLKKHKSKRLIVDVRKQEIALPFIDAFVISKDLVDALPASLKIAYIVTNPPQQSQAFFTLMTETLGRPVQVFYTTAMAKAWFENEYAPRPNPFIGKVKFPSISK